MLESPPRESLIQRLLRTIVDAAAAVARAIRGLFAGDSHVAGYREKIRTAPKPAATEASPEPPPPRPDGEQADGTLTGGWMGAPEPQSPTPVRRKWVAPGEASAASAGPDGGKAAAEPESGPPESGAHPEAASPEPQAASAGPSSALAAAEPEPVLLGGSAPRRARPGDVILAQFAAYVARFEDVARRALEREAQPGEVRLGEETECRWAVGARVTVRCTARGLNVFTPTQSFVWDGDCRTLSFDIEVPADARPRDTVILFEAFVHDAEDAPDAVQVGRLRMSLQIGEEADDQPPQRVPGEAARTAFASYASEDRVDVLERVSSIRRSAGLEVFVDVVSLRMGEQWEPALREQIASCDRFLLFWSEHAAGKKWVEWEWQQALDIHGEDALELHLLRHTPIDSIPERLRRFHFNDVYLLARDAELYRREREEK